MSRGSVSCGSDKREKMICTRMVYHSCTFELANLVLIHAVRPVIRRDQIPSRCETIQTLATSCPCIHTRLGLYLRCSKLVPIPGCTTRTVDIDCVALRMSSQDCQEGSVKFSSNGKTQGRTITIFDSELSIIRFALRIDPFGIGLRSYFANGGSPRLKVSAQ